jgi:Domain of unknown function (DUF1835)
MNHIVNGDVVGQKIKELEGNIIVWREMYDFGPLSLDWSLEDTYKFRAQFFEQKLDIPSNEFIKICQEQYSKLYNLSRSEEVVLWFEHDRYDQMMLIYLLSELSNMGFQYISMVSIDKFPGIDPFHGLGQLSSEQLINLLQSKQKVTKEQINEGIKGWKAYLSQNPKDINKWIEDEKHYLPYLKQAFLTHKSFYPSSINGLNQIEISALTMLKEGEKSFAELFNNVSRQRKNDGISDLYFAALLNELMKGNQPLLKSDRKLPNYRQQNPKANLEITKWGLEVLNGNENRLNLTGIDWWLGGVHLIEIGR